MEAAMRSEEEMMNLILQVAKDDERVRAVYLNGSRTNPNAPKDCFQDYDVVYVVTDTKPYYENHDWINHFGTGIIPACAGNTLKHSNQKFVLMSF